MRCCRWLVCLPGQRRQEVQRNRVAAIAESQPYWSLEVLAQRRRNVQACLGNPAARGARWRCAGRPAAFIVAPLYLGHGAGWTTTVKSRGPWGSRRKIYRAKSPGLKGDCDRPGRSGTAIIIGRNHFNIKKYFLAAGDSSQNIEFTLSVKSRLLTKL